MTLNSKEDIKTAKNVLNQLSKNSESIQLPVFLPLIEKNSQEYEKVAVKILDKSRILK